MNVLLQWIDRWMLALSAPLRLGVCLLVAMIIAAMDYLTGYELAFSIFYLVPVTLGAWYLGRIYALLMAVFAASLWLLVDKLSGNTYSHLLIAYWNASVRFGFFIIVAELLQRLQQALLLQRELARHDTLTGLLNARTFQRRCAEHLALARRHPRGVCIAYLDLDGFKKINDTLGHAVGDVVLKKVAQTLTTGLRVTDLCARLGGDEFGLLLPETDEAGARQLFPQLHAQLREMARAQGWTLGFSIGVVVFSAFRGSEDQAIALADALMYRVKHGGRDRVLIEQAADEAVSELIR